MRRVGSWLLLAGTSVVGLTLVVMLGAGFINLVSTVFHSSGLLWAVGVGAVVAGFALMLFGAALTEER